MKNGEVHTGHRQRVKARCAENGLASFSPRECLELLLFYAIPQGDVNPQADALLAEFGSLEAIWHAEPDELMRVKGIGEHTALYLHALGQLAAPRHIRLPGESLATAAKAESMTRKRLGDEERECLLVFALNANHEILDSKILARGEKDRVAFPLREIAVFALESGAAGVLIAHNHPGGTARPSAEDLSAIREAAFVLEKLGCPLVDSLILGRDDCLSLAREGMSAFAGIPAENACESSL